MRIAIHLFCHSIIVDKRQLLKTKGPLLIASNHPNSFLDAIIFDILFDVPITALARGDAFKNKNIFRLLRSLKMLPVYRIREGAENLNINYDTFDQCIKIFKQNEAVLIFSEGLCVNEWHLRPLKKGTARLAFQAWQEGIHLKVLPAGINYSSFRRYGKKIQIHFGNIITKESFDLTLPDGNNYKEFNTLLTEQLKPLVYEIKKGDNEFLDKNFGKTSLLTKILLAPMALVGAIINMPMFLPVSLLTKKISQNNVHYDSIMLALLLLLCPLYLLIIFLLIKAYGNISIAIASIIIWLICTRCYISFEIRKDNQSSI